MITTASYHEVENEIVIAHDGEDIDLIDIDGVVHPAILIHQDMGEDWRPELMDQALADAGWERTTSWDTAARSATVRWSGA
jgi:hypothetical protein